MPLRYKILLSLNLVYCIFGATTKTVPAWRMFEQADALDFEMRDAKGHEVRLEDSLPKDSYLMSMTAVMKVATFICQKRPQDAPFTVIERGPQVRHVLEGATCASRP